MQLHRVRARQAAARVSAGAAHPGGEPAALNPHLPGRALAEWLSDVSIKFFHL